VNLGGVPAGEAAAFIVIALTTLGSGLASAMVKRTFHSVMFLGVALVSVASLYILLGSPLIGVIQILVYVGGILTLFIFAVMFVAGDDTEDESPAAPGALSRSSVWTTLAALAVTLATAWVMIQYTWPVNRAAAGLLGTTSMAAGILGWVVGIVFLVVATVAGILAWLGARHVLNRWAGYKILGTAVAVLILGLLLGVVANTTAWNVAGTDANQTQANDLTRVVDALFGPQVIPFEVLGVLLTAAMIGALVIARPLGAAPDKSHYADVQPAQLAESQSASDPALHVEAGK
jgi:NADH:ubiquinone oxidoreductase subunit 6 (subunit J)